MKGVESKKDLSGKYATKESLAFKSNRHIYFHKLSKVPQGIAAHKESARAWMKELGMAGTIDPDCNYFMFPVMVDNREELIAKYLERGIELGAHFSKSIIWATEFGYVSGECPNAEKVCKQILTLPTYYKVSDFLR